MQFMIIRRADASSEATGFPSAALVAAVPGATWLHPSTSGLRMRRQDGQWQVSHGPFADTSVAGFTFVEAADRNAAAALAARWPTPDAEGAAVLEIREAGCPGNCLGFATGAAPRHTAWAILLRSDAISETDLAPPAPVIDIMNRANQAAIGAGIALAGEGLKSSARGARVKFGGGKHTIIDGPFAEVKELIAGFWMIDVASAQEAMDWVKAYPFPHPGPLEVELRQVAVA
jgi:hypothetical protein